MSRDDEDMLSGSDMERELADEEVQNSKNKGKGRDLDDAAPVPLAGAEVAHELDNLPWCARRTRRVEAFIVLTCFLCYWTIHRVEKYRPATLDDVVSHADITSTSMRREHHVRALRLTYRASFSRQIY